MNDTQGFFDGLPRSCGDAAPYVSRRERRWNAAKLSALLGASVAFWIFAVIGAHDVFLRLMAHR